MQRESSQLIVFWLKCFNYKRKRNRTWTNNIYLCVGQFWYGAMAHKWHCIKHTLHNLNICVLHILITRTFDFTHLSPLTNKYFCVTIYCIFKLAMRSNNWIFQTNLDKIYCQCVIMSKCISFVHTIGTNVMWTIKLQYI